MNSTGKLLLYYQESSEQANEHLRLSLAFLGKHGMSPNPLNYTLAYEYILARQNNLIQAMDEALTQGPIPSDIATALYCRYILDNDSQRLETIRSEIRGLLSDTLSSVNQASKSSADSATTLTEKSQRLESESSVEELKDIISDVVKETRNIAKNSNSLKQLLDDTRHEIDSLREELDRTRQQATTDALTGLLNRRGLETRLQLACTEASQHNIPLTMLMIDIDHFKTINDSHGHLVGDRVLRNVGTTLSANIKGKDTVGRFGGEEFAVILHGTTLENAKQVGEILRLNIERSKFKLSHNSDESVQVTVSIGVSEYVAGENTDELLKRADEAMYASKRNGRNRVMISSADN